MALHRWINLDHSKGTQGVRQTRTVDEEAWPHAGQKCDWGPEWEQFVEHNGLKMSNDEFKDQFVLGA